MALERLDDTEVTRAMKSLPGWKRQGEAIEKTFDRGSFNGAIAFVNTLSQLAERADHHPDLDIRYRQVRVSLSTHDAGGLTQRDIDLARQVEAVSAE